MEVITGLVELWPHLSAGSILLVGVYYMWSEKNKVEKKLEAEKVVITSKYEKEIEYNRQTDKDNIILLQEFSRLLESMSDGQDRHNEDTKALIKDQIILLKDYINSKTTEIINNTNRR